MTSLPRNVPDFKIIIPARVQSTRLPNKPLLDICGQPMIIRVAQQAKKSLAKQVIVATDSEQVIAVCKKFNISTCLTSFKNKNGTERIAEAIEKMGLTNTDIVVNVQGDEPLINPQLINSVAKQLNQCPAYCNVATAAAIFTNFQDILSPDTVKVVIDKFGFANYFSRSPIPYSKNSQQFMTSTIKQNTKNLLPPYYQHIGIYAYRLEFLRKYRTLEPAPIEYAESLEQLRTLWHGEKITVFLTNDPVVGGIDTEADYKKVQLIISEQLFSNTALSKFTS